MKEAKIYFFKDREDYKKKITDDDIYNITGEKGSGKTFFGNMKDNNSVVVHLDNVYEPIAQSDKHDFSDKVRDMLVKYYGEDLKKISFEKEVYPKIVDFINHEINEKYIEGGSIADIKDIKNIKGFVIVKRTGVLKCFIRTIKRDYKNQYFMKIEIEKYGIFGKITRFFKIVKRRKKIFRTYHNIEKFIERLEGNK